MTSRVLIVEDHALLAQSLCLALRGDGLEAELCGDLSRDGILAAAQGYEPDVVLLDLDIGGDLGSSVSLVGPLHEAGAHVVMLTGVTDRARLAECVEAGAIGLLSKAEPFDRLLAALREAVEMGSLLSPAQRDELMAELRAQRAEVRARMEPFERLTARERQVLAALMDGQPAEAIAAEWVVSLATVRSQIRSLLMKLGVHSQLAAVALARRAGWSPESEAVER
jgi:DNA-binding NarL/FixJ family response regulator